MQHSLGIEEFRRDSFCEELVSSVPPSMRGFVSVSVIVWEDEQTPERLDEEDA